MSGVTPDPEPMAPALAVVADFYVEFKCGMQGLVSVQVAASVVAEVDVAAVTATCRRAATGCVPALSAWEAAAWEVGIRLGEAAEGRRLNEDFRNKDYVPNVLSFLNNPADGEDGYQGDIFLTLPVVVQEAAEQGKTFGDHLTHLVVHGLLHLAGYDHEDEVAAGAMESLETKILAGIGIADPYNEAAE